jgi:putative endonuclease
MTKAFYVYMMTNRSRVVLYVGITSDLVRRVWEHQNAEVKGFTKIYKTNRLVYYETFEDPLNAISREKEIKRVATQQKECVGANTEPDVGRPFERTLSACVRSLGPSRTGIVCATRDDSTSILRDLGGLR